MAGASQLIARLAARPVTPVIPLENPGLPLEAASLLEVTPVASVTLKNRQDQDESLNQPLKPEKLEGVACDLHFCEKPDYRGYPKEIPPKPPAPEPTEPRRNAWTITRGGKPICTICGAPMTRAEALAEARWRWPDADIE